MVSWFVGEEKHAFGQESQIPFVPRTAAKDLGEQERLSASSR